MAGEPVVVLVEDDRDTRDLYADCLTYAGFDVHTASDADAGFTMAIRLRPHVVVTDFWLKGSPTGAQLCQRLKNDERTEHIRTLLVTASSQRKDAEAALEHGCAVVRLKPYLPDAMERDIRLMLANQSLPAWPSEHERP